MGTRAGMSAGRFRWFMLGQRLPESSPQAIPDLPPAWVIRGEDPQTLLRPLGLGRVGTRFPAPDSLISAACEQR